MAANFASATPTPKVYIIILTHKGWTHTLECLESLFKNHYPRYQVIVVDNCSGDLDYIRSWARGERELNLDPPSVLIYDLVKPCISKPRPYEVYSHEQVLAGAGFRHQEKFLESENPLILIQAADNLGYSYGNNIGIQYALNRADAEYVWILNNDTVIDKDAICALVKAAELQKAAPSKKIGIWASKLLFYYAPDTIQGLGGRYHKWLGVGFHLGAFEKDQGQYDRQALEMDYVIGAAMFVAMDFIKEVGLLNEEYFLYFEEPDWAIRGRQKGWGLGYAWQSRVYHKEGGFSGTSQQGQARSIFSDYYGLRNRLIFTRKFYPYALPTVYASFLLIFLNRLRRRQWGRLKLVWRALTGQLGVHFKNEYE